MINYYKKIKLLKLFVITLFETGISIYNKVTY